MNEEQDYQTYDLSKLVASNNIVNMSQNGNFLRCVTDTGQIFRHSIPAGKVLNKNTEGKWILEELNLRG